ncbi:MAG: uroporphyrinogen-III C-methyltransferase [Candidatus Omnitrophica bacterium]|nr:uroporphyrinogen-III C-methyltransferase [Candidatus Omnitrophota bacterium]
MKNKKCGKVYLVGAGPGDPALLTLGGQRLLAQADVVIYDGLVNPRLLLECPKAKKINAGKKHSRGIHKRYIEQVRINRMLVAYARKGLNVVRLKGGDPFVFGRGGEEALYLRRHRIAFEVVPGVSAAQSVPAYAGIPITDRHVASSVMFVTCHEDPSKNQSSLDWKRLATEKGTLVFFMGVKNMKAVMRTLTANGMPANTRVSVIERGTFPGQRVIEGTVADIAARVQRHKIQTPALTVVGKVNAMRREIAWFEKRALHAKKILVTRAQSQAGELSQKLLALGAEVMECPVIRIEPPKNFAPLDRAVKNLHWFDWIIFTSTNGVDFFFKRLHHARKDARALSACKVAAIGSATQAALLQNGIRADLIPESYHSKSLVQKLKESRQIRGKSFLLPRTDIAPEFLNRELEKGGARVAQVTAYRTIKSPLSSQEKNRLKSFKPDYVLFTSSSTVDNFFKAVPAGLRKILNARYVSIGPVTSQTLKKYGVRSYRQAREHTIDGLIETLVDKRTPSRWGRVNHD